VLDKLEFSYSCDYAAGRPHSPVPTLSAAKLEDPQRIAVLDTRVSDLKDLRNIATSFGVQAVGPFWRVDRAQKGPFTALAYKETEPNPLQWMFVTGTDLVRSIGKEDPFATWEWRDAYGVQPNPAPTDTPRTLEELRVAHNVAVSQGDAARASALLKELDPQLGKRLDLQYSDGLRLDGVLVHDGAAIVTTLFWEADASFKAFDTTYKLKCKVAKAPHLWIGQTDSSERDMAPPIRVLLWKPGYLYAQQFIALPRVGRDECRGSFSSDIHPKAAGPDPVVVVYE
jgi:hypothetical protein